MKVIKKVGGVAVAAGILLQLAASVSSAQDALTVDPSGNVGVGTATPINKLHVLDGNLRVEQSGEEHASLNFYSNGTGWEIKMNKATGRLTFFSPGGGASTASFKFDRSAVENLFRVGVLAPNTVDINGNLVVTGSITPDYVFTSAYELETIEEHSSFMWENKHLPSVEGAEVNAQGKGVFNVAQRSQGVLEELEKAHIYIAQLHGALKDLEERLDQQELKLASKDSSTAQ